MRFLWFKNREREREGDREGGGQNLGVDIYETLKKKKNGMIIDCIV